MDTIQLRDSILAEVEAALERQRVTIDPWVRAHRGLHLHTPDVEGSLERVREARRLFVALRAGRRHLATAPQSWLWRDPD